MATMIYIFMNKRFSYAMYLNFYLNIEIGNEIDLT